MLLFFAQWKIMGKGFLHKGTFHAYVCGDRCKALRRRMQSFALAVAMLCVGRCNALREIGKVGTQKSLVLFWISEKGGKTHHTDC